MKTAENIKAIKIDNNIAIQHGVNEECIGVVGLYDKYLEFPAFVRSHFNITSVEKYDLFTRPYAERCTLGTVSQLVFEDTKDIERLIKELQRLKEVMEQE